MSYAPIQFHFHAKTSQTQKKTTRLNITKIEGDGYEWRMVTYYEGFRSIEYLHLYSFNDVLTRINPMMCHLICDSDPFESVNIDFPGFPSVKINTMAKDFPADMISQAVFQVLINWPKAVEEEDHVYDDCYDEEDEEDEEDEYADMPALIPTNECGPCDTVECECMVNNLPPTSPMAAPPRNEPPPLKRTRME